MKSILSILLLSLPLNACSNVDNKALQDYLAIAPSNPDVIKNKRVQPLIKLYNQFKHISLADHLTETYAENFFLMTR